MKTQTSYTHLVLKARDGDRDAFGTLMQAFEADVRAICRKFTRDEDDAEDLVLESFVEAYLKLDQLRNPEFFAAWLRTITRNLCRSWYRVQKAIPDPEILVETIQREDDAQEYDRVAHGIALLNSDHQQILDLCYRIGLSYQEIADDLGMPIGTVMSRIHRAKNALRKAISGLEDYTMEETDLAIRFRLELELLDALKEEVEAANGVDRVKGHSEPMVRLRQVIEADSARLVDLLKVADTDERLVHIAHVVRFSLVPAMPVLATCCLSEDEELAERAARVAERWILRSWYGVRGVNLLLDGVIASPATEAKKVRLLVRLIQTIKDSGQPGQTHKEMFELSRVLLGYPEEAFPVLWDAFWELDENDEVEYGVRKALAHLVEPLCDAAIGVFKEGDSKRTFRMLDELMLVPFHRNTSFFREKVHFLPARIHPSLKALAESDDEVIRLRALDACRMYNVPGVKVRETVEELIEKVTDQDPSERVRVLNEMGKRANVDAKDVILERLEEDEDPSVRETAVRAYKKVATDDEKRACLSRIAKSGDRRLMKVAARALYVGEGPRQRTELELRRIERIRGAAYLDEGASRGKEMHIDPILGLRTLPEIRDYEEEELTRIVASVCGDYSTTRRQMVMEGRHSLMNRENGVYSFTEIGEAVWRVGQFVEEVKVGLRVEK